jgi:hypothetical protein
MAEESRVCTCSASGKRTHFVTARAVGVGSGGVAATVLAAAVHWQVQVKHKW